MKPFFNIMIHLKGHDLKQVFENLENEEICDQETKKLLNRPIDYAIFHDENDTEFTFRSVLKNSIQTDDIIQLKLPSGLPKWSYDSIFEDFCEFLKQMVDKYTGSFALTMDCDNPYNNRAYYNKNFIK